MRNVALEIEALATSLNHYAEQSSKKAFREYLSSCTSVITKITYIDKDDTFALLQKPRKNKDIIIPSADKESWTVTLNKNDYVCKVDKMIEDGITEVKYA